MQPLAFSQECWLSELFAMGLNLILGSEVCLLACLLKLNETMVQSQYV